MKNPIPEHMSLAYLPVRHWRRLGDLGGRYRADGFALFDAAGKLRAWTFHWSDAVQLAKFSSSPGTLARPHPAPQFAPGARVATGFGRGTVTDTRWKASENLRGHWRYRIRQDDGTLVDAAESGVWRAAEVPPKNS